MDEVVKDISYRSKYGYEKEKEEIVLNLLKKPRTSHTIRDTRAILVSLLLRMIL
jgi:hypothetical protein